MTKFEFKCFTMAIGNYINCEFQLTREDWEHMDDAFRQKYLEENANEDYQFNDGDWLLEQAEAKQAYLMYNFKRMLESIKEGLLEEAIEGKLLVIDNNLDLLKYIERV